MKHLPILFLLLITPFRSLMAQIVVPEGSAYLKQKPPGLTPTVFARDIISLKDHYEYGSVFSRDGSEFYYAVIINSKPQIRRVTFRQDNWGAPEIVIGDDKYEYNDPFLSPDEKRLYFISDRAMDGKGDKKDFDIWYLERTKDGWSGQPINAGPAINSSMNEYYMSFTKNGAMYFSSNAGTNASTNKDYDIRSANYVNGQFQTSGKLTNNINTEHYEADVFVSPDEQYIIFCSERPEGLGGGDLYISFKGKNGEWEKAKNMGNAINTTGYEFCPFVTADKKYLFFSRDGDIFWVDAKIISEMK